MSEAAPDDPAWPEMQGPELASGERRRRWLRIGGVVGAVVALSGGLIWLTRDRIADNVISGQLKQYGLPGTYRIESVAPTRQVLRDVMIGDPAHPDLTIERVEIEIIPRFGFPTFGRITLTAPRLYGTFKKGKLSFGSLDKMLSGGTPGQPFRIPDLDVAIADGRARLLTDYGPVGLKLDGVGPLRNGFAGTLAVAAPQLAANGCAALGATLYGTIGVTSEQPRFAGPLRLSSLDCDPSKIRLRDAAVAIEVTGDKGFDGAVATLGIGSGAMTWGTAGATGLNATISATLRGGALTARYDALTRGLASPQLAAATLNISGTLRSRGGRNELDAALDGGGVRLGEGLGTALEQWERAGAGSLAEPLLRQARGALLREGRGSKLAAQITVRHAAGETNVIVPQGRLTGGSGTMLLAVSRVQFSAGLGAPRLAGNFTTGGTGLPRISGRLEQAGRGATVVRMAMAEYRAGESRVALPELTVTQNANGALSFTGLALASGPLPGGRAQNLAVPLDGSRSADGVLALWRRCATVRFEALAYANLALDRRSLLLCPGPGGAIVRSDGRGTRISVGAPGLDLSGRLGQTPIRIASGPVGYAQPGLLYARALDVALGPEDTATRFRLAELKARVGKDIAGTFTGTELKLAAVPFDLVEAQGDWRYAGGRLTISDGAFRLLDRAQVARFQPLAGSGASLTLENNRIVAAAALTEPASARKVADIAIRHDLGNASGHADLNIPALVFDEKLQPDMLTRQLLGIVANTRGTLSGTGVIDWTADAVTSSGRFGTESLDFAAAFGPVKGVSGTVEFTDLVNFITPPHQRLAIKSINPGIEVLDGEMLFQLRPGSQLAIEGGSWPFLGGTLRLQPATMALGVSETRRYVLGIEKLDAARFIEQMELANLSATGSFDGILPLVFDENGGRIEGGLLTSRPPGGNVSYVGALTYKDLSPIANYAFAALKSLDYRQMRIAMDGALEGEIVTRVRFDGVQQGAGAKRNFVTQRLGKLPLQFNVNLRAPFYALITSFKSLYDPAYVKDPRSIGLLDANGRPVARPQLTVPLPPPSTAGGGIQPPVSETKP